MIPFAYCAGCSHSRLHDLILSTLQEINALDRTIAVVGAGCSSLMPQYMPFQVIQAPPGQAPAVASGLKRSLPQRLVLTYQGDGDLAARGFDVLVQAAIRSESITVICLNNLVQAGSGGQMSPTTLTGQITTSTRLGRSMARSGKPLQLTETIAKLPEVAYAQRVSLHRPSAVRQAQLALHDSFRFQENGQGLGFVEVMGWCPPYWDMSVLESQAHLSERVLKTFKPGIYKNSGLRR